MGNRTYYRGPDAVVTDKLFVWHTTPTKGFAVRDLQNVGLVRADADPDRNYTAQLGAGAVIVVVAAWLMLDAPTVFAVAFLAVAVPVLLAATLWRMPPRRWELRATYRGQTVLLYASCDTRVFNQIARALRRAVEDARPPASGYDLAS